MFTRARCPCSAEKQAVNVLRTKPSVWGGGGIVAVSVAASVAASVAVSVADSVAVSGGDWQLFKGTR